MMETQRIHSSKNNKVTVPFYSPPSRQYGQTPAEIIKEARAAVMSPSAIGIKPVFTSRPFTPKEKERTLFGNVKKRNARPPSSFSLSYLQKQEAVQRVKLPSIGVAPKKKQHRPSHFRNVVSLDNLTEEYEAEILEEAREIHSENLPAFRKSYSCPQERGMTRAVSYTERMPYCEVEKGSSWRGTELRDEGMPHFFADDTYTSYPQERGDTALETSNYLKYDTRSPPQDDLSDSLASVSDREVSARREDARLGSGDYDRHRTYEETVLVKKTYRLAELQRPSDSSGDDTRDVKISKAESRKKKRREKLISGKENLNAQDLKSESIEETVEEKLDLSPEPKIPDVEMILEDVKPTEVKDETALDIMAPPVDAGAEKRVSTEPDSEYLSFVRNGGGEVQPGGTETPSKHRELLELYETARYYGVVLDESKNIVSSSNMDVNKPSESPSTNMDDIFGEKASSETKPQNHLENLKINFKQIDEKMKRLNGSIEKFERKLNAKSNHVRVINDNVINEAKVTGDKKVSSSKEFVMNSNKRYHVSSRNAQAGEKAYKKWTNQETESNPVNKVNAEEGGHGWDFFWKNTYFRNRNEDGSSEKCLKTQNDVGVDYFQGMIDRLNGFIKIGCENQEIVETTGEMYKSMKSGGYYNNNALENKFKAKLLRTLYQFADSEDPEVLLSLARIIFAVRVESSLSAACKMVFKVARSDANDHLFTEMEDILELFLEGIGRASPLEAAESCIYGYGALKFLTMSHNILSRALHLGALDLMTLHMKMINTASMEGANVGEQTQHALFQLTGALRHVAAGDGALPLFITTSCIPIMCKTLLLFRRDEDLVTNIARTLSLLSTDEDISQVLVSVENILAIMIDLIDQYKNSNKILIRLSYCLGNIVAHSDLARVQLSRNENSLTTLLNVLKLYIDKDLELSLKEKTDDDNEELDPEAVDDVIVKVIRIVANMSMNPVVGSNLSPATNEKNSLQLSQLLSVLLLRKDPGITLLATLGCLNNISYYCNTHSALVDITQGVGRVLGLASEDCQAEAARVLGNLTRHKEIRDLIYSTGGMDQLSKLLSSKDREVVRCACGALVNMMLDAETRKQFVQTQGIDKLVQALELFSGDWSLASLVCRAIWNSCAEDVSLAMQHNDMEHLLNNLANSLEEENWNDGDMVWEEFATIATDLLERINTHLEST